MLGRMMRKNQAEGLVFLLTEREEQGIIKVEKLDCIQSNNIKG